jgi:cytochrome c553
LSVHPEEFLEVGIRAAGVPFGKTETTLRSTSMARAWLVAAALALAGCSDPGGESLQERGRTTYLALCTSCHASDPAHEGALGPPVKGSSRELLEAKLLRGSYPSGYTPKRPTAVMPPMPQLATSIPDLTAFLE